MNRMFKLTKNEVKKTFSQKSTPIMLALLVVVVLIAGFILKANAPSTTDDWKIQLTQTNLTLQTQMALPQTGPSITIEQMQQQITTNNYRIDHDLPPIEGRSLWGFVIPVSALISLVSLLTIIVGAGAIAGEFSDGTIKLLLSRPFKRWKILLSKYLSVLLFALAGLVTLFVASFLIGGMFYGFSGVSQPFLAYTDGAVHEVNMLWHIFTTYGYGCVSLLMMVTFAFAISTVTRNNSLAVGISLFLMFTGSMIVNLLKDYSWVKYILFANTDLTQYINGTPLVSGMTMSFSLIVLAVYFVIFNTTSWLVFGKRDVAG
ncbi:ABC transporter permease [Desulfosporosinus fructosivorans]|uniref:ABC transporter permease n=2 Tax=Desulfosporosinus fructosivorans TaxID=2018669 RepID=A0A4Z0R0R3_9FIRM|nr:ABC transporter permease [Desulfosporosinus fructosivorans]